MDLGSISAGGSVSGTSGEVTPLGRNAPSIAYAKELAKSSGRRRLVPMRVTFVRDDDPAVIPPLARLASRRGRGGSVPIKLYVALIWRCSAKPFSTEISARKWATLLNLPDPNVLGARRITNALVTLESEGLVKLEPRRGDSTVITLLDESGDGSPYSLPSTQYQKAKSENERAKHRYFKIPFALWTKGYIQEMSASGIAMLLILLAERNLDGRPTWWSTELFPSRFNLGESARTKGTKELVSLGLLDLGRQSVSTSRPSREFTRERVRNTYVLIGDAAPIHDD